MESTLKCKRGFRLQKRPMGKLIDVHFIGQSTLCVGHYLRLNLLCEHLRHVRKAGEVHGHRGPLHDHKGGLSRCSSW